ncbi:MAG TPA: protein kinase [Candidatus Dormibacteraeota bacterium]|nr:protein kinase [Candidatus Dormibacteraeota bacterium]
MNAPDIKRIGKYEVIEILGRGGMGLVYRAFDRQLNREVAIKTVTEGFVGDQEMLKRFYQEAAKTGALKHPNIVIVYDLGEQDGFPYIVMEYLSGDPLDRLIQQGKSQPLAFKLKIVEQVCYALGYAHRNDVIHRDVKPANVIVQPDGVVKLLDFGIARQEKTDGHLTRTGHVIGTLQYMAPERLRNAAFDGRSDIFSVGILMFQLLTGQLPFTGDYNIVQKILSEKHPSLSQFLDKYPPALDGILDRALAKSPDDRYSTADEMAAEISSVAQELRKEQVAEWIQRAERLVQEEEFTSARDILLQVLKIDSQHTGARQMIAVVQQNLNSRQRAEQVRQLRAQAEEAASDKRFEEAIHCLEEACGLDPSSAELAELLEATRQKKRRREMIDGYLREADTARERGDLEVAGAVIAKALEVDREDSRVRAAHVALARLIEEAARQAKTRKLLENARKEIGARHFTAAIEALAEVERVDPSNPELITLQAAAKQGREQEQRRRILETLQNEVSLAATVEELTRAVQLVDQALERLPTEPSLMKLKGSLARKLRDEEIRRRVDEVALRCRSLVETSPEEALKLVHQVLHEAPGNERLLALQSTIVSHISDRTQEQSRNQFLTRAHDALSSGRYSEALRLLEACQKEGMFSPEIAELMDFARQEADRGMKNTHIQTLLTQAQDFMSRAAYQDVVDLLSSVKQEPETASLMFLLEDARARIQSSQRSIDSVLEIAEAFRHDEQFAEAAQFLEAQSPSILQAEPVQSALTSLRQASANELTALQAVGSAYAALDRPNIGSGTLPEGNAGSALLARIVPVFASRRKSVADRQLSLALDRARAAVDAGDKKRAARLLEDAVAFAEYASSGLQNDWQALGRKVGKNKMFGKSGQKSP